MSTGNFTHFTLPEHLQIAGERVRNYKPRTTFPEGVLNQLSDILGERLDIEGCEVGESLRG